MDRHLWEVIGDGTFFTNFFVKADSMMDAAAKASDILAGCDHKEVGKGRRFYRTVETHVVAIVKGKEL